jgi:DNA-binding beta-propeller fold protein YncE
VLDITVDGVGRVVINDFTLVHRMESDGTITTVAGTGVEGIFFSGDDGPATSADISVFGVAVDSLDRVLMLESNRIRRVEFDGTITTIAGSDQFGFAGDGGPATSAALGEPSGLAVDRLGRVVIADTGNARIRRIELDGTITTIAGTGVEGFGGDGGPATSAALKSPRGVVVDALGRVVIADTGNSRIRRVEVDGTIVTVTGNGAADFFGDGGPPRRFGIDGLGRVVFTDERNNLVRRVEVDGTITTIAGLGAVGPSFREGDGGPATSAALNNPFCAAVDPVGRVLIGELGFIRRLELDGTMTTIAGLVHPSGPGPAERSRLYPSAALVPAAGLGLLTVGGFGRAMRIDPGVRAVDVVVGYDQASPTVFGQARFALLLDDARGVAFDPVALRVLITEHGSGDLRVIGLDSDGDGVIDDATQWTNTSIAAGLVGPAGIVYDEFTDTFVVVEEDNHCLQRVDRDGAIVGDVYGNCGTAGIFPGFLSGPTQAVVSPDSGAIYVADTGNNRVLRVENGAATLVIGDGSVSSAGEGEPARLFPVNAPRQLALDDFGNLYIASTTTVRLVANTDGDADADGDDRVFTIFGSGARDRFPESDTFCLNALTVDGDGRVFAADACQGFLVELLPQE